MSVIYIYIDIQIYTCICTHTHIHVYMNNCHQKREKQQIPVSDPYPWIINFSYQPQMLPTNSEAGGR